MVTEPLPIITLLGDDSPGGAYLLRIRAMESLRLRFGRFKQGQLIDVPSGEYLYVGSAMSSRGSATLARRLLRHATRSDGFPHAIRGEILATFPGLKPPIEKRLHWNVDYLLEESSVELTHVIAVQSSRRWEDSLARLAAQDPATFIVAKGLGAHDAPAIAHLLGVDAPEAWWPSLAHRIEGLITHR